MEAWHVGFRECNLGSGQFCHSLYRGKLKKYSVQLANFLFPLLHPNLHLRLSRKFCEWKCWHYVQTQSQIFYWGSLDVQYSKSHFFLPAIRKGEIHHASNFKLPGHFQAVLGRDSTDMVKKRSFVMANKVI